MAGRHRRARDSSALSRRLLAGAIAACLSVSLFSVTATAGPREAKNDTPSPPEVVEVIDAPVIAIPIPVTTTPVPTTEPVIEVVVEEPIPEPVDPIDLLDTFRDTGFNGVKPHVAQAGHLIADLFGVKLSDIGGVAGRRNASDHPLGLALDFMCNRETGDDIAEYVLDHAEELDVYYVIWRQRINYGSGWEPMEDRGDVTANHYDHVHVSFNP